jgi:hypothetical protein
MEKMPATSANNIMALGTHLWSNEMLSVDLVVSPKCRMFKHLAFVAILSERIETVQKAGI